MERRSFLKTVGGAVGTGAVGDRWGRPRRQPRRRRPPPSRVCRVVCSEEPARKSRSSVFPATNRRRVQRPCIPISFAEYFIFRPGDQAAIRGGLTQRHGPQRPSSVHRARKEGRKTATDKQTEGIYLINIFVSYLLLLSINDVLGWLLNGLVLLLLFFLLLLLFLLYIFCFCVCFCLFVCLFCVILYERRATIPKEAFASSAATSKQVLADHLILLCTRQSTREAIPKEAFAWLPSRAVLCATGSYELCC